MSMQYCFKFEGRKICISVPVAYNPFWWIPSFRPEPIPWRIDKPEPLPWVVDELLNPRVERDINILAAINELTEKLTPELRKSLHNEIVNSVEKLQLPTEVTIEMMPSVRSSRGE